MRIIFNKENKLMAIIIMRLEMKDDNGDDDDDQRILEVVSCRNFLITS